MFDQGLHKEITNMKEVFTQMETEAVKCSVERKTFKIKEKELLLENDHLLELLISQDLVHNSRNLELNEIIDYQSMKKSFLDGYSEFVELNVELSKKNEMVEKAVYDELSKRCARMENRCISLEIKENADILCEIVKQARELRPLDSNLDSALISSTSASGSKPPSNTKKNRILRPTSSNKKNKVEDHLRSVKPSLNKNNRVSEPICNANVKHYVLNANYKLICATCNECMFDAIHDLCVLDYVNDVRVRVKSKSIKSKKKKVWKPKGKVFTNVGYSWRPTGRTFTIDGNTCRLTRITSTIIVPPKKSLSTTVVKKTPPSSNTSGKLKDITNIAIKGYGDYQIGNVMISQFYYVEGLGHNLFLVGQFCDYDLEMAFRKHTCFVCGLEGVDLLKVSRGSNLYTLSLEEMMQSSPICLLSKASKTKSWLWH
ncbi:hypothetical protein Tco_0098949 [Tanacetum coccineum]